MRHSATRSLLERNDALAMIIGEGDEFEEIEKFVDRIKKEW
jgi:hypothetical protein